MDRVNYLFYQLFLKIKYEKRRYFLYVLSFYVGLLLPTCCIANTRSVEQVIYYTTFKGMEDSFQVDWLSRTFNTIKLDKEISYSISAFYEESFPEWENQYVSIKGIDESYFYPLPKIEGRTFSKKELQEGKDVCLMNKQYARMHACEIGDMIQIRDKRLKVIGLIDNSVYSGMIIPYQTMLNVYKEEKDIQFSGTFFCENELQKQKRIDEVIEQIKEKDNQNNLNLSNQKNNSESKENNTDKNNNTNQNKSSEVFRNSTTNKTQNENNLKNDLIKILEVSIDKIEID